MGDRVAKSGTRGESPAAQPSLTLLFCGVLAHPWAPRIPPRYEARVSGFRLFGPSPFFIAKAFDIVGAGGSLLAAAWLVSSSQFEVAKLLCVQSRSCPGITFAFTQKMPDQHRQFASRCNSRHVLTAPGAHAQKESAKRSGRPRGRPSGFDQHAASMSAALLGDPSVVGGSRSRLPDAWVKAKITHELFRRFEPARVSDRGYDCQRDDHVDAGDGHDLFGAAVF